MPATESHSLHRDRIVAGGDSAPGLAGAFWDSAQEVYCTVPVTNHHLPTQTGFSDGLSAITIVIVIHSRYWDAVVTCIYGMTPLMTI
jgi:hypothetical protein